MNLPFSEKIGQRLAQFINSNRQQPAMTVYIYVGLKAKPAKLLAAINNDPTLDAVSRSAQFQRVYQKISTDQQNLVTKIGANHRTPYRYVILNNTITSTFTIDYILNTLIQFDEVEDVEMVHEALVEDFFGRKIKNYSSNPGQFDPPPLSEFPDARTESQATKLAANFSLTGNGVLIGLVDTGVDLHPEVSGQLWNGGAAFPNHGKNFGDGDPLNTSDVWNHGTQCAGIIVSGTYGIATDAVLMILKVVHTNAEGKLALFNQACWEALDFAVANGCHICSLAGSFYGESDTDLKYWREHLDSMFEHGVPLVVSTGSFGDKATAVNPLYCIPHNVPCPANQPPPWIHPDQDHRQPGPPSAAISINPTTRRGGLWSLAARGPATCSDYPYDKSLGILGLIKPDFCAPGGSIPTCAVLGGINSSTTMTGSSPAASHFAGCLALMLEKPIPATTPPRKTLVKDILNALSTKTKLMPGQTAGTKVDDVGAGFIQVFDAYTFGKDSGWW